MEKNIIISLTASILALSTITFITGCTRNEDKSIASTVVETNIIETTSVPVTTEMPKIEIKYE